MVNKNHSYQEYAGLVLPLFYIVVGLALFALNWLAHFKVTDYSRKTIWPYTYIYNDLYYESFTSSSGDELLARKFSKFNKLGYGTLALIVTEADYYQDKQQLVRDKLNLDSGDGRYLLFVVEKTDSLGDWDISLVVGRAWQGEIDYEQKKYILYKLLVDPIKKDGNLVKAFNKAVDYSVERLVSDTDAGKITSMKMIDVKPVPKYESRGLINVGTIFCLLMMIIARLIFTMINNGGVLFGSFKKEKQSAYSKFYSENFNSLKVIWWLLMGTRLLGGFKPRGGGLSGGGGAGAKW